MTKLVESNRLWEEGRPGVGAWRVRWSIQGGVDVLRTVLRREMGRRTVVGASLFDHSTQVLPEVEHGHREEPLRDAYMVSVQSWGASSHP